MNVPEALAFLGQKTPDEIVQLIEDMGIRGVQNHPCRCPVAKLLLALTQRPSLRVHAGPKVRVGYEPDFERYAMPPSLARVVKLADRGMLPELIEPR